MHDVQSQAKHAELTHFGSKEELEKIGLFLTKNLTVNYSADKVQALNNSKFPFFFILLFSIYSFVLLILI